MLSCQELKNRKTNRGPRIAKIDGICCDNAPHGRGDPRGRPVCGRPHSVMWGSEGGDKPRGHNRGRPCSHHPVTVAPHSVMGLTRQRAGTSPAVTIVVAHVHTTPLWSPPILSCGVTRQRAGTSPAPTVANRNPPVDRDNATGNAGASSPVVDVERR